MHIIYPYNEILPTRKAHDVYIFQECAAFAEMGIQVTLLIGKGSWSDEKLSEHYLLKEKPANLTIVRLPIVRKNNFLNISWNRIFFHYVKKYIKNAKPDYVIISVFKLADFLLKAKRPSIHYLYEIHELSYYPGLSLSQKVYREASMLSKADLIITTTPELKSILEKYPYSLKKPIEFIPLAVKRKPLNAIDSETPLRLCYVGQLYKLQGIRILIQALSRMEDVQLKVVGGTAEEVLFFQKMARDLQVSERVHFTGFLPPTQLENAVTDTHLFVAPFEDKEHMPYVAHTKLMEYVEWRRPFIAPNIPNIRKHFGKDDGALFFTPGDINSLINVLKYACNKKVLKQLVERSRMSSKNFSWDKRIQLYSEKLRQNNILFSS